MGIVSNKNSLFRPDDNTTRAETFAVLMKSVCMDTSKSDYPTWERRVYETAKYHGITTRSWEDFQPQQPILRQELFVIIARLNNWGNTSEGCLPQRDVDPVDVKKTPPVIAPEPVTSPEVPVYSQKPGTFELYYEDDYERVLTYIIKS